MLCADLVYIYWKDQMEEARRSLGYLKDISPSGACLQLEVPILHDTAVRIAFPKGGLRGTVRYCIYREIGYFVGIEFDAECRWSRGQFQPQYLIDPRLLVIRGVDRAKLLRESNSQ
jgi:hypothetical protein